MNKFVTASLIISLTSLPSTTFAYTCDIKRPKSLSFITSDKTVLAPRISGIETVIGNQSQFTVTGTFSAKSNKSLLYLDGTEGNIGDTIPGLELGTLNYHIDNTRAYSGDVSLFADAAADNEGIYDRFIFNTPQQEIYFSYLTYIIANDFGAPEISPQLKLGRINMEIDSHSGPHILGATWDIPDLLDINLSGSPSPSRAKNGLTPLNWDATKLANTWVRHEGYVKILEVGINTLKAAASYRMFTETGETVHFFAGEVNAVLSFNMPEIEDYSQHRDNQNISECHVLNHNSDEPTEYVQFILPFFKRKTTDLDIWVDDVYINTSPERVELCDGSPWENCANRVLQNTISRTTNTITFDYNPGHLNNTGNLYVYVINRDGSYNKQGFLLPK